MPNSLSSNVMNWGLAVIVAPFLFVGFGYFGELIVLKYMMSMDLKTFDTLYIFLLLFRLGLLIALYICIMSQVHDTSLFYLLFSLNLGTCLL